MHRDNKAFRDRFQRWKNGEQVYQNGTPLPSYGGGKQPKRSSNSHGFSAATLLSIDNLYRLLTNKGFDPISAAGIIGNAIQESSLNPDSVNALGYSGLFQNSKEIRKAIEEQYGDYSLDSQLRYLDDWTSASTWIRKGKYKDHTAFRSGAFKKTGYNSVLDASDAFMKLYERPVILDKSGKVIGYQDHDKRRDYSQRVYDYVTGAADIPVQEKPMSQTTAAELNAASQFKPVPITTHPDYSLTNPAPSYISAWNNADSPAYTTSQLNARRIQLPTITEMLEDYEYQPLFRGYGDGKEPEIKQGPKKIPIDRAEDWANSKSDGNYKEDYWKEKARPAIRTTKQVIRPYRNVINRRGTEEDLIDIAMDVAAGAAGKIAGKIKNVLKPVVTPVVNSLKGKTPRQVGQYFEKHPELTRDIDPTKLQAARDFIMGDAFPRVQKEFAKRGKNLKYKPTSTYKQADFMDSDLGGVSTPNGVVYMRNDPKTQWLVHEEAHEMRRKTGETAEETAKLFTTYANSPEFLKAHPEYNALAEYEAINTELRYLISHANGGVKGKDLDWIIDHMPYEDFERYAIIANAYTNDAAKHKLINPKTWKDTQKTVGMANPRDEQGFIKAAGGIEPWGDDEKLKAAEEWAEDWQFRTTPAARSKVLQQWNAQGQKPQPESSEQYTQRRINEETKRTWMSDAADIAHGIGEGVLSMHPYTAIPYFGAKVGQDILNGNLSWETALNASIPMFHLAPDAAPIKDVINYTLEDAANLGSTAARNMRVAREFKSAVNNKPIIQQSVNPAIEIYNPIYGYGLTVVKHPSTSLSFFKQPFSKQQLALPAPEYSVPEAVYTGKIPKQILDFNAIKQSKNAKQLLQDITSDPNNYTFREIYDAVNNPAFLDSDVIPTTIPSSEKTIQLGNNIQNELKKVNAVLEKYGYDVIPEGMDDVATRNALLDRISQHRTFGRGVYLKPKGSKADIALTKLASKAFGVPEDKVTAEMKLLTAATHTIAGTAENGRSGLLKALYTYELPYDKYDAIYTSNRDQVMSGYSNPAHGGGSKGKAYFVRMPINDKDTSASLTQLWENNEFPILDVKSRGRDITDWRKYGLPYMLKTGRDLNSDIKGNIDDFLKYRTVKYSDTHPNWRLQMPYALTRTNDFGFYSSLRYGSLVDLLNKVERSAKIQKHYGIDPLLPYGKLDDNMFNVKYPKIYDDFLLNTYLISNFLEDFERYNFNAVENELSVLFDKGIISRKQYFGIKSEMTKEYGNPYRYINPSKLIQSAKNKYFSEQVRERSTDAFIRKQKVEKQSENLLRDFMLLKAGVRVNRSLISKDGYRIFTTEGIKDPDPTDIIGQHFVIVGPKDKKLLNIVKEYEPKSKRIHHGHGGNIVEGLSRNLGSIIPSFLLGTGAYNYYNNTQNELRNK